MSDFVPSAAQAAAIAEVRDWFENRTEDQQVFRLFGYAGSGKSTVLKFALDDLGLSPHRSAKDGSCELCVRDHGRGVPAQEMGRIFEPFVRGTEAEESGVRGTGIGLSIVKETAHAHDGTVEVENANPGARFRMVWPCPPVAGAGAGAGAGSGAVVH